MQNISELMVQMKNVFKNPQKELLEKEKANISLSRLREMHLLHFFFLQSPCTSVPAHFSYFSIIFIKLLYALSSILISSKANCKKHSLSFISSSFIPQLLLAY